MYKQLKLFILVLITLLLGNTVIATTLTPEQQQAKELGIKLYQYDAKAADYMLIAAEAGDTEAMVYLGIMLRSGEDLDANKWLEKAAKAGDIYAMFQLTQAMPAWSIAPQMNYQQKDKWQKKGEALALQRAQAGDPESMYIYYRFTNNTEWLEKAANGGYARAQMEFGQTIRHKKWTFESTKKAFELEWTKKAADNGDPRAMLYTAWSYRNLKDQAKAQEYLLKAVELSYIDAVKTYIRALDGLKDDYWNYGFEVDKVKAYALTLFMADAGVKDRTDLAYYTEGARVLSDDHKSYTYVPPLTDEQIKQGNALKEQWAKTHPPLTRGFTKLYTGETHSY